MTPNFSVHNHEHNWYDAEKHCQRDHGHLASIHDAAENKFIQDLVLAQTDANTQYNVKAWMGLHLQGGKFKFVHFFFKFLFIQIMQTGPPSSGKIRLSWNLQTGRLESLTMLIIVRHAGKCMQTDTGTTLLVLKLM